MDVTRPLAPAVVAALHSAVDEQAATATFQALGPEAGYGFLREAIAAGEYGAIGVDVSADEIFIGDGSKSDSANIQELFADTVRVAVTDPVYPVYVDSNAMAGRLGRFEGERWTRLSYMPCDDGNGYRPTPPRSPSNSSTCAPPNNPTGTTLSRADLENWVDYARETDAVILFDVAYRAFITGDDVPRSILESGADEVAIEFGSVAQRPQALLVSAARGQSFPRGCAATASPSTRCGCAGSPRSSTAPRTSCSAPPRQRTAQRGARRCRRTSTTTLRTRD